MARKTDKPPQGETPPGKVGAGAAETAGERPAGKAGEKPPSFEAALGEVEEIVAQLEAGEKGLEESLKLYERGVAALRVCHGILDQAEQRIRKLVTGPDGAPVLQELKLAPTGVPAETAAEETEAPRPARPRGNPATGAAPPETTPEAPGTPLPPPGTPKKTGGSLFGGG